MGLKKVRIVSIPRQELDRQHAEFVKRVGDEQVMFLRVGRWQAKRRLSTRAFGFQLPRLKRIK